MVSDKQQVARRAEVERQTRETSITASLGLDGPAAHEVSTGVPFLDHMLETLARHGFFDISLKAKGDLEVDDHHTVEDVGLVLGEAFSRALGDRRGIARFGYFEAPLDEALIAVTVDLSGRPFLVYNVPMDRERVGTLDTGLIEDFFQAFMSTAGMNLHINLRYGRNPHHIIEATFKAFAKALTMACRLDERVLGVPSTKGTLTD